MRSTSSRTNISTFDEVDGAAAEEVFEAAGGGDDETGAAVELVELGVLGEAAADEDRVVLREPGTSFAVGFEDLHGEFAGGEEDERTDGAALALGAGGGGGVHALDHRDEEAEGLAGAGGGGGEDVVAFEGGGDGLGLDGRGGDEAGGGEAVLQGVGDVEVGEAGVLLKGETDGRFVGGFVLGSGVILIVCFRLNMGLWFKSCGVQDFSFWMWLWRTAGLSTSGGCRGA